MRDINHKFVVGQRVLCVDAGRHLKLGEEYVIADGDLEDFVRVEGKPNNFFPNRFVAIEPVIKRVPKAGDMVIPRSFADKGWDDVEFDNPGWGGLPMDDLVGIPVLARDVAELGWRGRPWLKVGGYIWHIDYLDVVEGNDMKDAVKKKVKKAVVKKPRKLALRSELDKKVGKSAGVCSYVIEQDDGVRRWHIMDICHARLTGPGVAVALHMRAHHEKMTAENKKTFAKFLNYALNRSLFAHAFKTKKASEALSRGILMDVTQSNDIITFAAVAIRQATEHQSLETYQFARDHGYSEHAAWFAMITHHKLKDDRWAEFLRGWHSVIDGGMCFTKCIQAFKVGLSKNDIPFTKADGRYKINKNWYGDDKYGYDEEYSVKKALQGAGPAIVIGAGWDKQEGVDDAALLKRLAFIEKTINQVKK